MANCLASWGAQVWGILWEKAYLEHESQAEKEVPEDSAGSALEGVRGGGVRGKQLRRSQEASSQGLSEAFERMTHPQQPGHLGWCS